VQGHLQHKSNQKGNQQMLGTDASHFRHYEKAPHLIMLARIDVYWVEMNLNTQTSHIDD
jgi:hypothetical protein